MDFLSSLKITIATLVLLAITIILSAQVGETNLSSREGIFYNTLTFFDLADMFHSWWFIALLSLFSLNLLTCSLKRLPHTLRILKPSKKILFSEDFINGQPLREEWSCEDFKPQSSKGLIKIINKHFKKPLIKNGNNGLKLFAEKGKYNHLGFYLAHLAILVMIMGGIFNSFGYQGSIKIKKGEDLDTFILKSYPETLSKKLGFSIRCDDYKKIYYEGSDKVKDYQSTLTILNGEEKTKTVNIDFSHPLKYQGVYIYQTLSGHVSDEGSRKKISLHVTPKKDLYKSKVYQAKVGDSFEVEETGHTIKVNKLIPDYAVENIDGTGSIVPAVELTVLDEERKLYQGWVSAGPLNKDSEDYYFYLSPRIKENVTYTTLKISKRPGEHLIWFGFIAMIIGFGISFFIPHRRIWLQVQQREGIYYLTLAGATTKNLKSFEKDFGSLCQEIRKQYQLYETEGVEGKTINLARCLSEYHLYGGC